MTEKKMFGLFTVFDCKNSHPKGDIIFVHGLEGHPWATWHPQNQTDNTNIDFWPFWLGETLLEKKIDVNIWSFGYEGPGFKYFGQGMSRFDQASNLLKYLEVHHIGDRHFIFVTHSLGGLIVKQLIRTAQSFPQYQTIIEQIQGIVFLSTPHTGIHLANLIQNISFLIKPTVNIEELREHSPQLRDLNEWYTQNVEKLGIKTEVFYETKPMNGMLVVDEDSSNPRIRDVKPVAIPENYISIAKPKKNDLVYLATIRFCEEVFISKKDKDPIRIPYPKEFVGRDKVKSLLAELNQAETAMNFEIVINLGERILKIDRQHKTACTKTALAYQQRILNYYNQGKYNEVIENCDRAIILKPDFADFYYQRAKVYYQQKDWEKVIENCNHALKLKKESDYYWKRGLAYCEIANYDQAILDAENSMKNLSDTKAEYYYLYGRSLYTKAVSIAYPQAVESIIYIPHRRFYAPMSFINPQQIEKMNPLFRKAIDALNKAINKKSSKIASYYWVRGLCYLAQGNNNSAIDDFNYAHKLSPNQTNYDYNYLVGISYQAKGDQNSAIYYFTVALAIGILNNSSKDGYYYCRSLSYYNRGNSWLQNAAQGTPNNDDILALEDINKAIQINPLNLAYFTLKGWIEIRMSGGR